ncbi:MAG TPA: pantoate--beta-alanine ligase [Steroidobacteraceae bacterium]|nr:pantoate--beta-alanine ligase [Steroidobacteraceae bacterium]
MQLVQTIADLRAALRRPRDIILVPTMGNLHDGHLSLVRIARQRGDLVIASIFVNPLQFAPHEDFKKYPRTLEHDGDLLAGAGCDIVFAPAVEEMYPEEQQFAVQPPAGLADILEGSARPGFFTGVCTVVLKLFSIVGPSAAVFGKKDYQQLLVISKMVRQFALPIEIIAAETIRDPSGLALSSRNGYLNGEQRIEAVQLYAALRHIAGEVRAGRTDWRQLEDSAYDRLRSRDWRPDYMAIRRQADLGQPLEGEPMVVLGAAKLGGTRLIDSVDV